MELPVTTVTTFHGPEFNIDTVKKIVTKWKTSSNIWESLVGGTFYYAKEKNISWQKCMTTYETVNAVFCFTNKEDKVTVYCQSNNMSGEIFSGARNLETWTALLILLMSSACKLEKVKTLKMPTIKWDVPLKLHTLELVDWIMFARFSGDDVFLGGGSC